MEISLNPLIFTSVILLCALAGVHWQWTKEHKKKITTWILGIGLAGCTVSGLHQGVGHLKEKSRITKQKAHSDVFPGRWSELYREVHKTRSNCAALKMLDAVNDNEFPPITLAAIDRIVTEFHRSYRKAAAKKLVNVKVVVN